MEFPWRCNVDTIAMDLKVSWEMSDIYVPVGLAALDDLFAGLVIDPLAGGLDAPEFLFCDLREKGDIGEGPRVSGVFAVSFFPLGDIPCHAPSQS